MFAKLRKGIIFVAVLIAVAGVWQWGIKPRMARFQVWEGTLEDAYRMYDHSKETWAPHPAEYRSYRHYWKVLCDDGEVRTVELPYRIWGTGRVHERVIKESGTPWPRMAEPDDEDKEPELEQSPSPSEVIPDRAVPAEERVAPSNLFEGVTRLKFEGATRLLDSVPPVQQIEVEPDDSWLLVSLKQAGQ